jgi:glycosyltransferase involved in cell wall biosynthesis
MRTGASRALQGRIVAVGQMLVEDHTRPAAPAVQYEQREARIASAGAPSVSVVIPTLNEERNVGWVLQRLPDCVDEVIVVDGRSTDATIAVTRLVRPDTKIVLELRPGKGAALRAGFAAARGDYVAMIDADGSMEPAEIEVFIAALKDGSDLVKGSRFLEGGGTSDMSVVRKLGNAGLRGAVNALYGTDFTDLCYGFMAFRRTSLEALHLASDGFEIETEIVVRAIRNRLRVREVASFEAERRYGESNLSAWRDGRRVFHTLLRERFGREEAPRLSPRPSSSPEVSHAAGTGPSRILLTQPGVRRRMS